jgi:hypothetical protein
VYFFVAATLLFEKKRIVINYLSRLFLIRIYAEQFMCSFKELLATSKNLVVV